MKTSKQQTGAKGEDEAQRFLLVNGFVLRSVNHRIGRAEIDIIASKKDCLHFVEVKTRKNNVYGFPEEFVSERKIELFHEAAEIYIAEHDWSGGIQFDIIAITKATGNLEYFEDAF